MTNASNNSMTLAEFGRLLEVYGSDRTRWPVEARAGAGHLVARDRSARRLLVEAEALDRVLERAPLPSLANEAALADRIAAAALRSPRMVRLGNAGAPEPAVEDTGNVFRLPNVRMRRQWPGATILGGATASVLAASLAIGILIGLSSLPQRFAPALHDLTGMTLGDRSYVLLQVDPLDEDLL